MTIEIKHRYTGLVLYTSDARTMHRAVEAAIRDRANLTGANLTRADLTGANLAGANLAGANLTRANLADANLAGANLAGANLTGAYLRGAYLRGAYLRGAYLTRANLADAYLTGANLTGANLRGADLAGADLAVIRDDVREILDAAPNEVPGLLAAVREGRVNGSVYAGTCACLLGTIANVRGCSYMQLGIEPDSNRPAEAFFLSISPGHVPAISPHAALAEEWIVEWMTERAQGAEVVS